jgi:putative aldouronate transport system permease protein
MVKESMMKTENSRNKIKDSNSYKVFTVVNYIILTGVLIATLYPIYYVVIASFSDADALAVHSGILLKPLQPFTLDAYKRVFANTLVRSGYINTLFILVVGLCFNMVLTSLGGYFLALKDVKFKNAIAMLILFTMYFNGGIVPMYLNVKSLGMMDSLWSLILPSALNTYNLLIMRSAFASIPDSLIEAAKLDGASHFKILKSVMIPLSKATLAVMVLYYGVGHWNAWFNASLYIQSPEKFPLQLVLRNILINSSTSNMTGSMNADDAVRFSEMIKYALIVVSSAPIVLLYPFLQRFFTKGVMIGAVKG